MNPIFADEDHSSEVPAEHADQDHRGAVDASWHNPEPSVSRRARRKRRKVRRRRRTVVMFIVVLAFIAAAALAFQVIRPMLSLDTAKDYPGPGGADVTYTLKAGATARSVASDLVSRSVVASENAFLNALDTAQGSGKLLPGVYPLKKEMKAADAVTVLLAASTQQVHYAPIAQNLRQSEVFDLLAASTGLPVSDFTALAKNPSAFGLPAQAPSLEGYLAPGQYQFPVNATAKDILTTLVKATKDELAQAGVTDPQEQFRVVTIASILEAEGRQDYYPQIAGAIMNRLNNPGAETGGRLESDATVAYGLGLKTYNITDAQKADASNPYNTFANKGLPIGPIGSPKLPAIQAAAHPQSNPYYFWVTVNLDTGETLFATTFAEHQANVQKYQQWCTANQGKCS
ncbi:endolytic transglycosylase MltG [Psychromicrobium xiongbiense]|uniref:endolytic transglycosylase MltG n=1 Tax=Psychromicrobium xiongbiense TaxID=3051184 RepID=UPI0025525419|nr:endolytic transglycosylase MltG [Psychromicrobium sp. YIM S02556]